MRWEEIGRRWLREEWKKMRKEEEEGIVKEAEIDWEGILGRNERDVGEGEEDRRCIPHRNGRRWKDLKRI